MSYTVTQDKILNVRADAAVICIENQMIVTENPVSNQLAEVGGVRLLEDLLPRRFIPVGSACEIPTDTLPFAHIIAVAAPRWFNGESNEKLILGRCYASIYAIAEAFGIQTVAVPFLSTHYFRFPQAEAVEIAKIMADSAPCDTIFIAETPELYELSQTPYRKPKIVRYVGYYRDYAAFELDNGLYARVDIREEMRDVNVRPYVDSCFWNGFDPEQLPLPDEEIERLRQIYEEVG